MVGTKKIIISSFFILWSYQAFAETRIQLEIENADRHEEFILYRQKDQYFIEKSTPERFLRAKIKESDFINLQLQLSELIANRKPNNSQCKEAHYSTKLEYALKKRSGSGCFDLTHKNIQLLYYKLHTALVEGN